MFKKEIKDKVDWLKKYVADKAVFLQLKQHNIMACTNEQDATNTSHTLFKAGV